MSIKFTKQQQLEFILSECERKSQKVTNKEIAKHLNCTPNEVAVMKTRRLKKLKKGTETSNALTLATKAYDSVAQDLLLYNKNEEEFVKQKQNEIKFNTLSGIANVTKAFNKHLQKLTEAENLDSNDASLVAGSMFNIMNRKQAK